MIRAAMAVVGMVLVAAAVQAKPLDCEALRARIETQAKAKGLKAPRVEVVAVGDVTKETEARVVGRCAAGAKRVLLHPKG